MSESSNELILPANMSDDEALNYTQRIRKGFIDHSIKGGFPSDIKDQAMLLSAMSDMDRTAIQNKRIGTDASSNEADRLAALMIAKMSNHFGATDPFEVKDVNIREFPEINESLLPPVTLVPGETEVGISDLTYDEFSATMAKPR